MDENKVLCKLPTCNTNLNESMNTEASVSGSSWCETFEQFLAYARVKETSNLRKNKRKKVSVQPGKSMTSKADLSEEEDFDMNQPSTSNDKCVKNNSPALTSDEKNIKQPPIEENTISGFSKGVFVVVELLYDPNT